MSMRVMSQVQQGGSGEEEKTRAHAFSRLRGFSLVPLCWRDPEETTRERYAEGKDHGKIRSTSRLPFDIQEQRRDSTDTKRCQMLLVRARGIWSGGARGSSKQSRTRMQLDLPRPSMSPAPVGSCTCMYHHLLHLRVTIIPDLAHRTSTD